MRKLADHRDEDVGFASHRARGDQRLLVIDRVDERYFPVLADADTGLRSFDPAATDALPRVDALGHRCLVDVFTTRMRELAGMRPQQSVRSTHRLRLDTHQDT